MFLLIFLSCLCTHKLKLVAYERSMMAEIGLKCEFRWDASKSDSALCKLMDVTKLHNLRWHRKVEIVNVKSQRLLWLKESIT